jgi:hypothetical protein
MARGTSLNQRQLISFITGSLSMGESPTLYLDDKTKDKYLAKEMKKHMELREACAV